MSAVTLLSLTPASTANRARYAGKDFYTIVDDLVTRIQALFLTEYSDFVTSGVGMMLVDMVAWAGDTLAFYLDRQASESYLATAKTRRAVARLTRQIGYKMAPAVASSVDLTVSLSRAWVFAVTLGVGFQFQGPNGLVFEVVQQVTFAAGTTGPQTVSCREGATKVETFASDGSAGQRFLLSPGNGLAIAMGSFALTVAGAPWVESDLMTFDASNQYEVGYNDDPPTLYMGNGVAGNIPLAGAAIQVKYVASAGKAGEAPRAGTITTPVVPLVVMGQQIPLVVTNVLPPSGADDPETLEEAKANAPRWYKARNVAVTQEDYVGLASTYADPLAGRVGLAQAFVAHGAGEDMTLAAQLDSIRVIAAMLAGSVTLQTGALVAVHDALENVRLEIAAAEVDLGAQVTALGAASAAARSSADDARSKALQISVDVGVGLAAGTLAAKDAQFTAILTSAGSIATDAAAVRTQLNAIDAATALVTADQTEIGLGLTTMAAEETAIMAAASQIASLMTTTFVAGINTQLAAIFAHVDGFLADDCKANLVQVPILTRDLDGFLATPPTALIRSLERFLIARKEVTQVVEVVDGSPALVPAVIAGVIGILPGYVQATVIGNVAVAIDDLLRARSQQFGQSLHLSDVYSVVVPNRLTKQGGIAGVDWADLKILGPMEYLNSSGDLVLDDQHVITKGTVSLTPTLA